MISWLQSNPIAFKCLQRHAMSEKAAAVKTKTCILWQTCCGASFLRGCESCIYLCLELCSWLWRCPRLRERDRLRCLLLLSLERERERRLSRDVERERLLLRSRERDLVKIEDGATVRIYLRELEIIRSDSNVDKSGKCLTFYALCSVIWSYKMSQNSQF